MWSVERDDLADSGPSDEHSAQAPSRRALLAGLSAFVALSALPTRAQTPAKPFTPEQLDQILAPIALYQDALLSQILMAASYPLEIVEAARWSQANPALKGDAAVNAVQDKTWDVSVKSLVAFPPVLAQMNEHLDWTQKLGDAMIEQQDDVADSIQRLRARAADAGTLKSSPEQTVNIQTQGSERIIAIEQANPQVVYVPQYNPSWAYGTWPYPASPPVYYPFGGVLATGFLWGLGFAAAGAMFGGWNWGYGGGQSYVNVNASRATNIDRSFNRNNIGNGNRWQHQVDHRRGVAYRDQATRDRFGQNRPGADQRQQFRGRTEGGPGARPGGPGGVANARPGGPAGGIQRPGGPAGGGVQRPGGPAGGGIQQRPAIQNPRGQRPAQRPAGGGVQRGLGGVNQGQRVNREAQRGRAQQQRAAQPRGGGGGGARAGGGGGGGGRPGGGGGGGRPGGRR